MEAKDTNMGSEIINSWSKEDTLVLIEEYKKHELLYKPQHPEHIMSSKRKEAIMAIVDVLKNYKPNVTESMVRAKLKTLRRQFNDEKKKMTCNKKSGAGFSTVHRPSLWCFEDLSFLFHQNEEISGTSNVNISKMFDNNSVDADDIMDEKPVIADDTMDERPVIVKKPKQNNTDSNIENFQRTADMSLQIMQELSQQHRSTSTSKEDAFCEYLKTELKALKLEESFDEVHMDILLSLTRVKAKERNIFNVIYKDHSSP